jgi:PAS domain S-box-containing protein
VQFQGDAGLAAEVERLRTILERQPACLLRVGIDGTMLALSDAAVRLLGASTLAAVLDSSLLDHLVGDASQLWGEFVARVCESGSASVECDMTDLEGSLRVVLLQGTAMPGQPDGHQSLLVTARDVTAAKRLEASLQEVTADRQRLRDALDRVLVERQELAAALDQLKLALGTAIDSTLLAQQVVDRGKLL